MRKSLRLKTDDAECVGTAENFTTICTANVGHLILNFVSKNRIFKLNRWKIVPAFRCDGFAETLHKRHIRNILDKICKWRYFTIAPLFQLFRNTFFFHAKSKRCTGSIRFYLSGRKLSLVRRRENESNSFFFSIMKYEIHSSCIIYDSFVRSCLRCCPTTFRR